MNKENSYITEYYIVTDDWRIKKINKESEVIAAFDNNGKFLFIYRTFLEIDKNNFKTTTGDIEYYQRNGNTGSNWSRVLSFKDWCIENLDTRGYPFSIKDPIKEVVEHGGNQEELEELYNIKWPEESSYIGFVAKILYALSKYKNWDDYKNR